MQTAVSKLDLSAELVKFQTQPKQMPAAAHGKVGELRLGFSKESARSVLSDLYRVAPLLVQQALYWDEEMPELPICSIISVGGGILQGDRNSIEINLAHEACAHITTQGATKIHAMDANYATQHQTIRVANGGYLEYIPDTVIPYSGSRFLSNTDIYIAPDATAILSEIVCSGRKYHNKEMFKYDLLSLTTRVHDLDGRRLVTDKMLIEPQNTPIENSSIMGEYDVFGTVYVLTPPGNAARIRTRFRGDFTTDRSVGYSVSALPNQAGLMLRLVARESYLARLAVRDFWRIVREETVHCSLSEQPYWQ